MLKTVMHYSTLNIYPGGNTALIFWLVVLAVQRVSGSISIPSALLSALWINISSWVWTTISTYYKMFGTTYFLTSCFSSCFHSLFNFCFQILAFSFHFFKDSFCTTLIRSYEKNITGVCLSSFYQSFNKLHVYNVMYI